MSDDSYLSHFGRETPMQEKVTCAIAELRAPYEYALGDGGDYHSDGNILADAYTALAAAAQDVVEMWRAGPGQYEWEEIDAAMAALADATPPRPQPPVDYRPEEGDPF